MFVDRVITLPVLEGPSLPGLPHDQHGFIPVDSFGRVSDLDSVYAAGDVTAFPLKQGGLATQQADAVAATIAAAGRRGDLARRRSGPCCADCCSPAARRSTCAPSHNGCRTRRPWRSRPRPPR